MGQLFLRSKFFFPFVLDHSAQRHFTAIPSIYNYSRRKSNYITFEMNTYSPQVQNLSCTVPLPPLYNPAFISPIPTVKAYVCIFATYPPPPNQGVGFLLRCVSSSRVVSATAVSAGGRRRRRGRGFADGVGIIIGRAFFVAAEGEVDAALVALVVFCGVPVPLDHAFCFWSAFVVPLQRGKEEYGGASYLQGWCNRLGRRGW